MNRRRKGLFCIFAVGLGVLAVVNLLAWKYSSVFFRIGDMSGRTALHWAAWDGRASAVKTLLAKGADVNSRDRSGDTPLHDAAFYGHKKVAEVLIASGADVNAREYANKCTPLYDAAAVGHVEIVKMLLAAGADATARNRKGWTPLDAAMNTLANSWVDRFFSGRQLRACVKVLSEHGVSSAGHEALEGGAMGFSTGDMPTRRRSHAMVTTRWVVVVGMAMAFVGYVWTAVVAFRKDVVWGIGCLFAPINLIFVVQNWDECRAPFVTSMVGLGICLAAFILGPTIDILMMIA